MAAAYAIESLGLSERRVCLLTGISPSVYQYKSKQGDDAALRRRMRELAWERKRFGSPRLHIMLKREGLVINHKRTERIYSEEGLALRKKRRRKAAAGVRETIPSPVRPNQRWSMDFVSDSTVTGRRFRALAIVDDYSRECPAIEVDTSESALRSRPDHPKTRPQATPGLRYSSPPRQQHGAPAAGPHPPGQTPS